MKIQTITSEHRNDFSAIMECEHCGKTHKLTSGYHDTYYHTKVIPAMHCGACGKNRAGDLKAEEGGGEIAATTKSGAGSATDPAQRPPKGDVQ